MTTLRVARYNGDGTLDNGFGSGGKVVSDIGAGSTDRANGVALQADGKIVVAGTSDSRFAVVRYESDGKLDSTFGSGGKVTTDFTNLGANFTTAAGNAVDIQPDGKLVVAGSVQNGSEFRDFALVRYNGNGAVDTNFGTGGKVATAIQSQEEDQAYAVDVQAYGKIVVVGETEGAPGQFAMVRWTTGRGFWTRPLTPTGSCLLRRPRWPQGVRSRLRRTA